MASAGLLEGGYASPPEVVTTWRNWASTCRGHRSTQISPELVAASDVVLGMARRHAREVVLLDAGGVGPHLHAQGIRASGRPGGAARARRERSTPGSAVSTTGATHRPRGQLRRRRRAGPHRRSVWTGTARRRASSAISSTGPRRCCGFRAGSERCQGERPRGTGRSRRFRRRPTPDKRSSGRNGVPSRIGRPVTPDAPANRSRRTIRTLRTNRGARHSTAEARSAAPVLDADTRRQRRRRRRRVGRRRRGGAVGGGDGGGRHRPRPVARQPRHVRRRPGQGASLGVRRREPFGHRPAARPRSRNSTRPTAVCTRRSWRRSTSSRCVGRQLRSVQDLSSASGQVARIGAGAIDAGPLGVGSRPTAAGPTEWWNCAALAALAASTDTCPGADRHRTGPRARLPAGLEARHLRARPRPSAHPAPTRHRGGGHRWPTSSKGPRPISCSWRTTPRCGPGSGNFLEVGALTTQDGHLQLSNVNQTVNIPVPAGKVTADRRPRGPVGLAQARPGLAEPGVHASVRRQRAPGGPDVGGRDGPARRRGDRRGRRDAAPDPPGHRAGHLAATAPW